MSDDKRNWNVLLVVLVSYVMLPILGLSINVALPSIGKDLSIDPVLLGWMVTSLLLATAVFAVPSGRIADIYGSKKIFLFGVAVCTATSFLLAASHSASALIFFRALQGAGVAMVIGTGIAIVSSIYPEGERGKGLGLCMAAVYAGQTLAPFLGGLITHHLGWRMVFLINVPFCVFIIGFTLWKTPGEWVEARGAKFDMVGSILFGMMLVPIIYGLSLFPSMLGLWLILAGLVLGVAFVKWELKVDAPVLDMHLFSRNLTFSFSILSALIFYSSIFAVPFLLSLYLQYIKGFTPQNAGFVLVVQPVLQAAFSPLAGRLADRVGPRLLSSMGMGLTASGLLVFALITSDTDLWILITGLILCGFGLILFVATNLNDLMGSVDKRHYGVASGSIATIRQVGMMFSMAVTMFIFSLYIGRAQVSSENLVLFLNSVKTAFLTLMMLCAVGVFLSVFRVNRKRI